MDIKPIETEYNGYRFRSRLEARWAVFFDVAGIKYEYEPEGFELDDGTRYLPDFYLPDFSTFCEVKGEREGVWDEIRKAGNMITWGGPIKRLVILGNIPPQYEGGLWHFPVYYWDGKQDYARVGWWFFFDDYDSGKSKGKISNADYFDPWYEYNGDLRVLPETKTLTFQPISDVALKKDRYKRKESEICDEITYKFLYEINNITFVAFDKARSARFEHGETPIVKGE